jgi:hypothetical protein
MKEEKRGAATVLQHTGHGCDDIATNGTKKGSWTSQAAKPMSDEIATNGTKRGRISLRENRRAQ